MLCQVGFVLLLIWVLDTAQMHGMLQEVSQPGHCRGV